MILNVPFVLFDCGAPSERIEEQKYDLAIIANEISSESLYEASEKMIDKLGL